MKILDKLFTDDEVMRIEWHKDNAPRITNNYFILINNKIIKVDEAKFRKMAKEHKMVEGNNYKLLEERND